MKFDRLWCCGKGMHRECTLQVLETNLNKSGGDNFGKCCLCRADVLEPTDGPRLLARLRVWVDKGKAWAEHNMGKIYEDGYPSMGVERSLPDAKAMYERAIKKGHAGSAANLGNMYMRGQGVDVDVARGLDLLEQSAAWGEREAMIALAQVCFEGCEGVDKDLGKAKVWAERALREGQENAEWALMKINKEIAAQEGGGGGAGGTARRRRRRKRRQRKKRKRRKLN